MSGHTKVLFRRDPMRIIFEGGCELPPGLFADYRLAIPRLSSPPNETWGSASTE